MALSLSVYNVKTMLAKICPLADGRIEIKLFVERNLVFLTLPYLALDVLRLILVIIVLHAELQLLDEGFLRVLVYSIKELWVNFMGKI